MIKKTPEHMSDQEFADRAHQIKQIVSIVLAAIYASVICSWAIHKQPIPPRYILVFVLTFFLARIVVSMMQNINADRNGKRRPYPKFPQML